jgi:cytoskeletal protein RodZ
VELVDQAQGERPSTSFGASLRTARLGRNVTLDAVATRTKLNRAFFQDLERDDLSKWPANQFYRESYLRAYCKAVGLDAREVIEAFRHELAAAAASNVSSPARPRRLTPVTIPIILATTFIVFYAFARWLAPSVQKPEESGAPRREVTVSAEPTAAEAAPPAKIVPANEVHTASDGQVPSIQAASPPAETVAEVPPPTPVEGELTITSTPSGATVLVNGINRGVTPARVQYLPPGSYTVRLIYAGYTSITQRATISASRPYVQVSATLEPPGAQN